MHLSGMIRSPLLEHAEEQKGRRGSPLAGSYARHQQRRSLSCRQTISRSPTQNQRTSSEALFGYHRGQSGVRICRTPRAWEPVSAVKCERTLKVSRKLQPSVQGAKIRHRLMSSTLDGMGNASQQPLVPCLTTFGGYARL